MAIQECSEVTKYQMNGGGIIGFYTITGDPNVVEIGLIFDTKPSKRGVEE